jgi:UDP:flavonoid glycosyltransferase YjiC (YdhE family)
MKFVLACYGMRGDVDPGVVVGRELLRRGHDVEIAVAPNLVGFAEASGLKAVGCGLDSRVIAETQRKYWTCLSRNPWRIQELNRLGREVKEQTTRCWEEMASALTSMAAGADLMIAGPIFEQPVVTVAESQHIPLATLHFFPVRAHGRLMPFLPAPVSRNGMLVNDWLTWRSMRKVEDVLRRERGLPNATASTPRRIVDGQALEIQAYDELCFPGLAGEWAQWAWRRPFVGALTMGTPTATDDEVLSWIAEGTSPIYFGFGSISVGSAADTIDMISSACAQLGERALIGAGGTDFSNVAHSDQVKVVAMMDYATVFPQCRAVVHHGGGGTTAAGLRGGVPQVICWTLPDQPLWGAVVKRLKVGTARRFSATTETTLVADLRKVLAPQYRTRARGIGTRMTKPADSVAATADLLEEFARLRGATA